MGECNVKQSIVGYSQGKGGPHKEIHPMRCFLFGVSSIFEIAGEAFSLAIQTFMQGWQGCERTERNE